MSQEKLKPFDAGRKAARLGLFRVDPYYEKPQEALAWYCGYDGKTLDEMALAFVAAFPELTRKIDDFALVNGAN